MVHKGVTLIELMVVITIMGIIGMGAQFALGSRTKTDLNAWAQEIKNDIRYSQRMAMAENRDYTLMFDLGSNSYFIMVASPTGGSKQVKKVVLDKGVKIYKMTPNTSTFHFTNLGTIAPAFTIVLTKNSETITFTGTAGAGRVEVK